jgi:hypothetical protein
MRSHFRFVLLAFTAVLAARAANAASVIVQWQTLSTGGVISDPLTATNTTAGSFTEANLPPGTLKVTAVAGGSAGVLDQVSSYAFVDGLTFTNAGAGPICFGGPAGACAPNANYPFDITLDASFSHSAGGPTGTWSQTFVATFSVSVNGASAHVAQVVMQAGEVWSGGHLFSSAFDVTTAGTMNGGVATVLTGTPATLEAILSMPMITLNPGDTMVMGFTIQASATASDPGFNATIDASSTAQARLVLPAGSSLTNDAAAPLQWVTVPEPSTALLLAASALAFAQLRRRRRAA